MLPFLDFGCVALFWWRKAHNTISHITINSLNASSLKAVFPHCLGVRPFPCPHCDKIFRTSGHRKTHIASHFKSLQQKKHRFPRKSNKAKVSKSLPLPDIPLQEPILITDFGKSMWFMYINLNSAMYINV